MKMNKLVFAAVTAAISVLSTSASAACSFSGRPAYILTSPWDNYTTVYGYNGSYFTYVLMLKPDPLFIEPQLAELDIPGEKPDPVNDLIQAKTMDGAPAEEIESFERSFILAAMTPAAQLEASAFEPQYEPPTPERVAGLIWNAYSNGDIPIESVDGLIEAYWKTVETEKRQVRERDEALTTN